MTRPSDPRASWVGKLLGLPGKPGTWAPSSSPIAWPTVVTVGVVTAMSISVQPSHVMAPPTLLGYAAVAGLLQALVSWFLLRRRGLEGTEHLTSLIAGAGAFALPFSAAILASEKPSLSLLFAALVCQLFCMFISWFALVLLLVPVTWMARGRAVEGDVMSQERAMLVSGATLGPLFLSCLTRESGLIGLFFPVASPPLDRLIVALLAALVLLAALRMVARTGWLARVRRGLVPGWMVARGAECARYTSLPLGGTRSPSRLPLWDGLSADALDGLLVYTGSEEVVEGFRQPSSAIAVAFLADSDLPWYRAPLAAWLVKLACLAVFLSTVLCHLAKPSPPTRRPAPPGGQGGAPPGYHPPSLQATPAVSK